MLRTEIRAPMCYVLKTNYNFAKMIYKKNKTYFFVSLHRQTSDTILQKENS